MLFRSGLPVRDKLIERNDGRKFVTTLQVNVEQRGVEAMNMILDLVKEKPAPASREVPFTLVERESVRVLKD